MKHLLQYVALCAAICLCVCYDGTIYPQCCHFIYNKKCLNLATIYHTCITWLFFLQSLMKAQNPLKVIKCCLMFMGNLHALIYIIPSLTSSHRLLQPTHIICMTNLTDSMKRNVLVWKWFVISDLFVPPNQANTFITPRRGSPTKGNSLRHYNFLR